MTKPTTLKEIYIDELRDLWSANHQMHQFIPHLEKHALDEDLKSLLEESAAGIKKHTQVLKDLVDANDGKHSKDHCKGMEGLIKEAAAHILDGDMKDSFAKDVLIVAQYQRMSHYGLAGFGTASAYAKALDLDDDENKLSAAVSEIHEADAMATKLAELALNLKATSA